MKSKGAFKTIGEVCEIVGLIDPETGKKKTHVLRVTCRVPAAISLKQIAPLSGRTPPRRDVAYYKPATNMSVSAHVRSAISESMS